MNKTLLLGSSILTSCLGSLIVGASSMAPLPAATSAASQPLQADASSSPSAWLSSFAAAQSAARQAGKPIFLVFR